MIKPLFEDLQGKCKNIRAMRRKKQGAEMHVFIDMPRARNHW